MRNTFLILFLLVFIFHSCDKDTDDLPVVREYSEQVIVDNDLIVNYLKTHTYNYDQLSLKSDFKVRLDTLDSSNSSKLSLYDMVSLKTVNVTDSNGDLVEISSEKRKKTVSCSFILRRSFTRHSVTANVNHT